MLGNGYTVPDCVWSDTLNDPSNFDANVGSSRVADEGPDDEGEIRDRPNEEIAH
jgi:hypothetical protein